MNLPEHIVSALQSNATSLGKCKCFPQYEDCDFAIGIVSERYDKLVEMIGSDNRGLLRRELSRLIRECKAIEKECKGALEKLCTKVVTEIFNIPEDTVDIKVSLVDKVDSTNQRMTPEESVDFTFDNIDDMNNLTGEIHKRRVLNALITGAALDYAGRVSSYIKDLFEINPDLPSNYKRIMAYNELLSYVEPDTLNSDEEASDGGKVDVSLGDPTSAVTIKAEGVIFPILLEETIKGILELAISHGLPHDRKKAMYVVGKADFKLAELWDMRLGTVLWSIIDKQIEGDGVEPNFLLMELSKFSCDEFNEIMTEIFAQTRDGKEMLNSIVEQINHHKEKDDFDSFLKSKGTKYQVNDEFFEPDELITDNED